MNAFQDQYGSSIPPKELPAQSYFEVLEGMVQDRVFYAESLAQVVSLDTENKLRLANPETHSQHVAMLFDGSTIRPKRRLVSSMPEDLEGFRAKCEIIANVWRMMKLRSPGRSVLAGLTENTWDTHRKWLMDSKRFAMELAVAPGVLKAPGWQLCLSYEQKGREAAMDLIRLQCLPSAEALNRVRNDQEHRMFHSVQLFMQPGHQMAISAPASSSSSSSSAKRSAAVSSNSQPSEVRALTSKLDKLASTVKLLTKKYSLGGKGRDRSRSPMVTKKKSSRGNAGKGKAKGKGKPPHFEDLIKQHRDKFVLKRDGQEVCLKFQDGNCNDSGCVRAHVCAACGRNASWKQCRCMKLD